MYAEQLRERFAQFSDNSLLATLHAYIAGLKAYQAASASDEATANGTCLFIRKTSVARRRFGEGWAHDFWNCLHTIEQSVAYTWDYWQQEDGFTEGRRAMVDKLLPELEAVYEELKV